MSRAQIATITEQISCEAGAQRTFRTPGQLAHASQVRGRQVTQARSKSQRRDERARSLVARKAYLAVVRTRCLMPLQHAPCLLCLAQPSSSRRALAFLGSGRFWQFVDSGGEVATSLHDVLNFAVGADVVHRFVARDFERGGYEQVGVVRGPARAKHLLQGPGAALAQAANLPTRTVATLTP